MSRQPNVVLKKQARKMVYDVYCFLKKEGKHDVVTVQETADATKTSVSTVRRIVKEAKDPFSPNVFKTPGRRRPCKKKITDVDTFDQSVIKRCIHNCHANNELPTMARLQAKLAEDINFKGSVRSLRRILQNLGFRWKKTKNNKKLIIEKSKIRLLRIEYLQKIGKYRQEGRPVVYTGESYVDSWLANAKLSSSETATTPGQKKAVPKGQRVVIVHAGTEAGFIPNALHLFKSVTKTVDYNDTNNFANYDKWLCCQLLPNLPPNSVLVVDNASHQKLSDPGPSTNGKRGDMKKWLLEKGIPFSENMLKPQLYNLIKLYKEQHKEYSIDKILGDHNHLVLRLPPNQPDLNPIEMAWAAIKEHVSDNNVSWNANEIMDLVKQKVATMGASDWSQFIQKVKEIEVEYIKSEQIVDLVTDEHVILADEDSDSGDDDDDDEDDEGMEFDDEPAPGTSSASGEEYGASTYVIL